MTDFTLASALSDFSAFASSQGLAPEDLLLSAGLPLDIEQHPENLISYRKFLDLVANCERQSSNNLFALQFGLFQGVSIFGLLFYLIRNATDVRAALIQLAQYYHIHSGAAEVKLEEQGAHAIISYTIIDPTLLGARNGCELALGIGMQLMRALLGSRWQPSAALLQHSAVAEPAAYRRLIGIAPSFKSACNGWVFDRALLDTPLHATDPVLHRLIQQHVNHLAKLAPQKVSGLVEQLIRNLMPDRRATIENIADYMMISTRTLQRQLELEGMTFQELLSSTRKAMASRYLHDSSIGISQLADLLGYSDQSAFSRAFQRWHGQSPNQWRKQQSANQVSARQLRA